MTVVAAGVTVAILGGIRHPGFLGHGQGVHICPQQEDFSPLAHGAGDTGFAHSFGLVAVGAQLFSDEGVRLGQVKAQFRIAVELAAHGNQFLFQFLGPIEKIVHCSSSSCIVVWRFPDGYGRFLFPIIPLAGTFVK